MARKMSEADKRRLKERRNGAPQSVQGVDSFGWMAAIDAILNDEVTVFNTGLITSRDLDLDTVDGTVKLSLLFFREVKRSTSESIWHSREINKDADWWHARERIAYARVLRLDPLKQLQLEQAFGRKSIWVPVNGISAEVWVFPVVKIFLLLAALWSGMSETVKGAGIYPRWEPHVRASLIGYTAKAVEELSSPPSKPAD